MPYDPPERPPVRVLSAEAMRLRTAAHLDLAHRLGGKPPAEKLPMLNAYLADRATGLPPSLVWIDWLLEAGWSDVFIRELVKASRS